MRITYFVPRFATMFWKIEVPGVPEGSAITVSVRDRSSPRVPMEGWCKSPTL